MKVLKHGRQQEAARGLDDACGTHARRDKSFWRACVTYLGKHSTTQYLSRYPDRGHAGTPLLGTTGVQRVGPLLRPAQTSASQGSPVARYPGALTAGRETTVFYLRPLTTLGNAACVMSVCAFPGRLAAGSRAHAVPLTDGIASFPCLALCPANLAWPLIFTSVPTA